MMKAALFLALLAASPADRLADAGKEIALGRPANAAPVLQQLRGEPGEVGRDAGLALGRYFLETGRAEEAVEALQGAWASEDLLADWIALHAARAHWEGEEAERARTWLGRVRVDVPDPSPAVQDAWLLKAEIAESVGEWREAAAAWEAFLAAGADHPFRREAAWRRAESLEKSGGREAAASAAWDIWWHDPGSPWAESARDRARQLWKGLEAGEPIVTAEEALEHVRRLSRVGRNKDAAREAAARIAAAPEALRPELRMARAEALYNSRENETALREAALLFKGGGAEACPASAMAARLYWIRLNRPSEAVATATKLARECAWSTDDSIEGGEEGTWILANMRLRGGRTGEAEQYLEALTARENRRREAAAWKLGLLQFEARRCGEAAGTFEVLAGSTDSVGYRSAGLYWAARSRLCLDQKEAARAHLMTLVEERPRHYYGYRASALLRDIYGTQAKGEAVPMPEGARVAETVRETPGWRRAERLERAGQVDLAGREFLHLAGAHPEATEALALRAASAYSGTRWASRGVRLMREHFRDLEDRPVEGLEGGPAAPAIRQAFFPNPWPDLYATHASRQGIPPALPLAISRRESLFDPEIRSWAGAVGLMQLMPATAAEEARKMGLPRPGDDDLTRPELNVQLGTHHLAGLLDRFDSVPLAVAAYNAGAGRVSGWLRERPFGGEKGVEEDLWIDTIPITQTRLYVKGVLRAMWEYESLHEPSSQGEGRLKAAAAR